MGRANSESSLLRCLMLQVVLSGLQDAGLVSDAGDPVCCAGTEEAAEPGVGLQV